MVGLNVGYTHTDLQIGSTILAPIEQLKSLTNPEI